MESAQRSPPQREWRLRGLGGVVCTHTHLMVLADEVEDVQCQHSVDLGLLAQTGCTQRLVPHNLYKQHQIQKNWLK